MIVRDARPEDAPRIAEIHVRAWQAAYREVLPEAFLAGLSVPDREASWRKNLGDGSYVLVAEEGDQVVGWLIGGRTRDPDCAATTGEIYAVYVDPGCWRRGAGRQLWARARVDLRAQGYTAVTLWVLAENVAARGFYERLGFGLDPEARKTVEMAGRSLVEMRYPDRARRLKRRPMGRLPSILTLLLPALACGEKCNLDGSLRARAARAASIAAGSRSGEIAGRRTPAWSTPSTPASLSSRAMSGAGPIRTWRSGWSAARTAWSRCSSTTAIPAAAVVTAVLSSWPRSARVRARWTPWPV
jgi:ribosomal protein S18 acetylase RimI-like enzyme